MDMKQTIMAGLGIAACTLASAKNIHTYSKLVASLRAGISVSAIIDVEQCHYADNEKNTWEEKTLGARFGQIYERVAEDLEHGKKNAPGSNKSSYLRGKGISSYRAYSDSHIRRWHY